MATRYYFPSTGAAAVSPAYDAAWNQTGQADRLRCVTTRISSAMTDKTLTDPGTTVVLWRQYVSDPIGAQTITGTVKAQARAMKTGTDQPSYLGIRVVSNDGAVVRGTLLAVADHVGTLLGGTLTNKTFVDGDTVTSVVAHNNDRLVFEIGNYQTVSTADPTGNFGDDSGTDLPEDETTTAAYNPWVELSQTIVGPSLSQSITDTLALAEALALKMGKALTDSITLTEAISLKTRKVITDPFSLADAVSTVLRRTVSVTDALSLLDALSLKTGKVMTESAALTDEVSMIVASVWTPVTPPAASWAAVAGASSAWTPIVPTSTGWS